ncbi:MAG: helix-turn-helix domain-containing protein [bacterium]
MKEPKKFYTTHEAAKLLYVTPTTVIQWIKDGKIKVIRTIGGHRRIPVKEIEKFIEENKMYLNGENLKTVLIIDEDTAVSKKLKDDFEESNYRAHTVKDAFEGGIVFERNKSDVVIVDTKMNKDNIFEICQYIKNHDDAKDTKIVALTDNFEKDSKMIEKIGADKLIKKPINNVNLIKEINELFQS